MKAIRKRLTYANVMSSLAVFLVLGGGAAFAAGKLAKNSVGSKQLKKNSVTAAKIKSNAVTGAKIKAGTITGAKINLGSLGTVPSAGSSNTAKSADTAATASNLNGLQRKSVRVQATEAGSYEAAKAAAPEVTLFTAGPLTVYGKCFSYSGEVYGYYFIKTSQPGAVFDAYYDNLYGYPYLNPNTPEEEREIYYESVSTNSAYYWGDSYYSYSATAADGTAVHGFLSLGLKDGTPTNGDGAYGPGNVCLFAGEQDQENS